MESRNHHAPSNTTASRAIQNAPAAKGIQLPAVDPKFDPLDQPGETNEYPIPVEVKGLPYDSSGGCCRE